MTPAQRDVEDRQIRERHRAKLDQEKQARSQELAREREVELEKELVHDKPRLMREWLVANPSYSERHFSAHVWPLLRANLAEDIAKKKRDDYIAKFSEKHPISL
jgi:hypothetical protein